MKKDKPTQGTLEPQTQEEVDKCIESPLYYYNTYKRLKGHKVLTQEEFTKKVEAFKKERDAVYSKEELEALEVKKAEVTFKDRPSMLQHTADKFDKITEPIKKKLIEESKKNQA